MQLGGLVSFIFAFFVRWGWRGDDVQEGHNVVLGHGGVGSPTRVGGECDTDGACYCGSGYVW